MSPATRSQKYFFISVGLLALWVGFWGLFVPTQVDRAIPWLIPPLHARFVGALYASVTVLMFGAAMATQQAEIRVATRITILWTGSLFIISLFYLNEFDFTHKPVWFWFGSYLLYPLWGLWLIQRVEVKGNSEENVPQSVQRYLLTQGILISILALLLLLAPTLMVNLWPWKITSLLAQIYSGPFLAYGIGSLLLAQRSSWREVWLITLTMCITAISIVVVSLIHKSLFSAGDIATWVWFGGFTIAAIVLGRLSSQALRN